MSLEKELSEKELLTVTEFAALVGVSMRTAYKYVEDGVVNSVEKRKGLKKIKYIPRDELEKFK